MTLAMGSDEAGFELKELLKRRLQERGHEVVDYGTRAGETALYPDVAFAVAEGVARASTTAPS
jgi:ribose 5-phosphate isomerase B